jgi:hypothetical protein
MRRWGSLRALPREIFGRHGRIDADSPMPTRLAEDASDVDQVEPLSASIRILAP